MVKKNYYDDKIDIWCVGILTYEIATGKTPFGPAYDQKIYKKIV